MNVFLAFKQWEKYEFLMDQRGFSNGSLKPSCPHSFHLLNSLKTLTYDPSVKLSIWKIACEGKTKAAPFSRALKLSLWIFFSSSISCIIKKSQWSTHEYGQAQGWLLYYLNLFGLTIKSIEDVFDGEFFSLISTSGFCRAFAVLSCPHGQLAPYGLRYHGVSCLPPWGASLPGIKIP